MVNNFHAFSQAVATRFAAMAEQDMFIVDVSAEVLWETYIHAFPEGTNPIYRTNTEHDCNCCRHFIRDIGNVVAVVDGKLQSIWTTLVPAPYNTVAVAMQELVETASIRDVFVRSERTAGIDHNIKLYADGTTVQFDHFHCSVPAQHVSGSPLSVMSKARSNVGVIARAVTEISPDVVAVVLDLIADGALYRGTEDVKKHLETFQIVQQKLRSMPGGATNTFVWSQHSNTALLIRNTSIGQLLQDLTKGTLVEDAVRKYEAMVSPANYRRTTAIITKGMVNKALEDLQTLGLRESVYRRHATLRDVSVNDIVWANRSATSVLGGDDLADLLASEVKPAQGNNKDVQNILVEHFISDVLPSVGKLEAYLDGAHTGNLVSITAAEHEGTPSLFAWGNQFAWSYKGDVTDSVKARVKAKGGNVSGWGRASLSWFNYDDLDIHVSEPNGTHIYYGNKYPRNGQGHLDVDMNVPNNESRSAVENITWPHQMQPGEYKVFVNNFSKRESIAVGFDMEFEFNGVVTTCSSAKSPQEKRAVAVAAVVIDENGVNVKLADGITGEVKQSEVWGLKTGEFAEVNLLMLSPNHWGNAPSGLKHWFFLMDTCKADEPVTGFYNEFLRNDLQPHRKVFEVLAGKTKCPVADQQLGGLGFSSTTRNNLIVRIDGGRKYNIQF